MFINEGSEDIGIPDSQIGEVFPQKDLVINLRWQVQEKLWKTVA